MLEDYDFPDDASPDFDRIAQTIPTPPANGFNPGLIVLIIVMALLLAFFVGNYFLFQYAQTNLPQKKKKPFSSKKLKREKRKQGVSIPGE